jgi:hypothetical protein
MAYYGNLTITEVPFTGVTAGTAHSRKVVLVVEPPSVSDNYNAVVDFAKANYVSSGITYPPQVWY